MRYEKIYRLIVLVIPIVLSPCLVVSQLSPGKLTSAHQDLEGIRNCTLCHDLGKKVSNTKCLDCHDIIDALLNDQRGYHAHSSVREQDCFACHSEHHGRNFEMIRFDEENFDHRMTGYELEGSHRAIGCRECHQTKNIVDAEVLGRDETFLGLDRECMACHEDFHLGELSSDCASCHNTTEFRPASLFDHDNTAFALNGAHMDVSCVECHPLTSVNGLQSQQFTRLSFTDCSSCHSSPHNNNMPGMCVDCHDETSFSGISGSARFDHNLTQFQLSGAHLSVSCFDCHESNVTPARLFQEFSQVNEENCVACHQDVHEGRFGNSCTDCHNTESFHQPRNMDQFDHNLTNFPLEGLHQNVDCTECHLTGEFTQPIPFSTCTDCHEDAHYGEFTNGSVLRDCRECHDVNFPFTVTQFGFEEHQETAFSLNGSHLAIPCSSCHLQEDEWHFRNIGSTCIDCHTDVHEGHISKEHYPQQECTNCHSDEAWSVVNFDHQGTAWPLTGQHLTVECRDCHIRDYALSGINAQVFQNLSTHCNSCHEDVHASQFAKADGITDCNQCHLTENWTIPLFDHNKTNFILEGKHAEISCAECHQAPYQGNPDVIMYKLPSFQCIDCHL